MLAGAAFCVEVAQAAGLLAGPVRAAAGEEPSIRSVTVGVPVPVPNNLGDTWVGAWARDGAGVKVAVRARNAPAGARRRPRNLRLHTLPPCPPRTCVRYLASCS